MLRHRERQVRFGESGEERSWEGVVVGAVDVLHKATFDLGGCRRPQPFGFLHRGRDRGNPYLDPAVLGIRRYRWIGNRDEVRNFLFGGGLTDPQRPEGDRADRPGRQVGDDPGQGLFPPHPEHFPWNPRHGDDGDVAVANEPPGGGADRIVERDRRRNQPGLFAVLDRHFHAAGSKEGFNSSEDAGIDLWCFADEFGDCLPSQIIGRGPDPAGADDQVGIGGGSPEDVGQAGKIVAGLNDVEELNTGSQELLGEVGCVGIGQATVDQFGADRSNWPPPPPTASCLDAPGLTLRTSSRSLANDVAASVNV